MSDYDELERWHQMRKGIRAHQPKATTGQAPTAVPKPAPAPAPQPSPAPAASSLSATIAAVAATKQQWKEEYDRCISADDFRRYLERHHADKGNPHVNSARMQYEQLSAQEAYYERKKRKREDARSWLDIAFIPAVFIGVCVLIFTVKSCIEDYKREQHEKSQEQIQKMMSDVSDMNELYRRAISPSH